MKKLQWIKLVCFIVITAIIVGTVKISSNKVGAEESKDATITLKIADYNYEGQEGETDPRYFRFTSKGVNYPNYWREFCRTNDLMEWKDGKLLLKNGITTSSNNGSTNEVFRGDSSYQLTLSPNQYGYYEFDSSQKKMKVGYDDGKAVVTLSDWSDSEEKRNFLPLDDSNFYFAMSFEHNFYLPADGKINGQDMIFEFAGDDDVWVVINDAIVLDLGGIHGVLEGKINFAEQKTYYEYKGQVTEFVKDGHESEDPDGGRYDGFWSQKVYDFSDKIKNTLKKNDTNTLRFFYLERGGVVSNCRFKFNLYGTESIYKAIVDYVDIKDKGSDTPTLLRESSTWTNTTNGKYDLRSAKLETLKVNDRTYELVTEGENYDALEGTINQSGGVAHIYLYYTPVYKVKYIEVDSDGNENVVDTEDVIRGKDATKDPTVTPPATQTDPNTGIVTEYNVRENNWVNEDGTTAKLTDIQSDITVYKHIDKTNKYNVTYRLADDSEHIEGFEVPGRTMHTSGETVDVADSSTYNYPGYVFEGWTPESGIGKSDITNGEFKMPANNVVFVGKFVAKEYKYSIRYGYEKNGAFVDFDANPETTKNVYGTITVKDPAKNFTSPDFDGYKLVDTKQQNVVIELDKKNPADIHVLVYYVDESAHSLIVKYGYMEDGVFKEFSDVTSDVFSATKKKGTVDNYKLKEVRSGYSFSRIEAVTDNASVYDSENALTTGLSDKYKFTYTRADNTAEIHVIYEPHYYYVTYYKEDGSVLWQDKVIAGGHYTTYTDGPSLAPTKNAPKGFDSDDKESNPASKTAGMSFHHNTGSATKDVEIFVSNYRTFDEAKKAANEVVPEYSEEEIKNMWTYKFEYWFAYEDEMEYLKAPVSLTFMKLPGGGNNFGGKSGNLHGNINLYPLYTPIGPKPTPTATPTATPTPTAKPTATPVPTNKPTATPVPTNKPTATPKPTNEPTATPKPTNEPTATPKPTDEPTATPKPTNEPTATPVPTNEPTATPKPTNEPTATPVPTNEPTPTAKPTEAPKPTNNPAPEVTPTPAPETETIDGPGIPGGSPDIEDEPDQDKPPKSDPDDPENIDLDGLPTAQGGLPQTGAASSGWYYGFGAAMMLIGRTLMSLTRRRED